MTSVTRCSQRTARTSPDTATCATSDAQTLFPLTSYVEASRVSHIALPANGAEPTTNVISGPSSDALFASLGQDGSWLKTSAGSCQLLVDGSLEEFCETWPTAGMMRNGACYVLPTSARPTNASASSSLPTPAARDY